MASHKSMPTRGKLSFSHHLKTQHIIQTAVVLINFCCFLALHSPFFFSLRFLLQVKVSDPERLAVFEKLMWDALALMEPRELLKLVEFATAHRTILKTLKINLVRVRSYRPS
jgi:hypothetical protein